MVTFPKFLLFVDITWFLMWFIVIMTFEGLYPSYDAYRIQVRMTYRHIVCTLALAYIVGRQSTRRIHLLGVLPFIFTLLDDTLNVVNLMKRISPIESQVAYNFTAAITWMALSVSILATFWFISHMGGISEMSKINNRREGHGEIY